LKYIVLIFAGILLVFFCSTIQHAALSQPGEYYYSGFLRNNYTVICASLFFITGIAAGYFFSLEVPPAENHRRRRQHYGDVDNGISCAQPQRLRVGRDAVRHGRDDAVSR